MRIAILGATSTIAKDFILQLRDNHALMLFSRKPKEVDAFMQEAGLRDYLSFNYHVLPDTQWYVDAVINFVGIGDPVKLEAMGADIFPITYKYDELALRFLRRPNTKYIFISSGAAYGDAFDVAPAGSGTKVTFPSSPLPQHYYGLAKHQAEVRHRTLRDKHIVDVRVFNYISGTQNINLNFMAMNMIRSIKNNEVMPINMMNPARDFIGPVDLAQLIVRVLMSPGANGALDCYTREPITKDTLLAYMQRDYGLKFKVTDPPFVSPTGLKTFYYSRNFTAEQFGYRPLYDSWANIKLAADTLLGRT
jgi:nucleoside-diphosphate-sugar epimerase